MGRLRNSRRKRHKQQQSRQRRPPESDPEHKDTVVANKDSPTWNSLDERGLSPGADYAYNAGLSSDEMEVTRKLSCLNFSMIPCAPSSMMVEPQDMYVQGRGDARGDGCDIETSDVEFCSEQAFATQHELLPTLSDKEMEIIELAAHDRRQSRKRPAKRRPNRKAKRIKSASNSCTPFHTQTKGARNSSVGFQPPPPLTVSFTRSSSKEHPTPLRRAKSFRRPRRSKPVEDPLLGFFSDTSAVCEMDVHQEHDWNTDDMIEYTPPVEGDDCVVVCGSSFDPGVLTNESDLTESTTTDSGCEGDDEESSVEGPVSSVHDHNRLAGWWDKDTIERRNSDDEKFTQILHGSFPLMSKLGQEQFKEQLESSSVSEFKHPGRFGICRKSGGQKRRKPSVQQLTNSPTLKEINQRIIDFVRNSSEMELRFNLISRALCRTISCMASVYNLECQIEQKRRLPVATPLLLKTPITRLASQKEVEPILKSHGRESPTMSLRNFVSAHHSHSVHKSTVPSRVVRTNSMESEPSCVVGGEAPALDGTNVGNRMLQCMGWTPGTGLGAQGTGIKDPVPAHIRPKYVGLGY